MNDQNETKRMIEEDENIVLFPSSYRFPISTEEDNDPLEELLHEFDGVTGDWEDLDDEEEESIEPAQICRYENWSMDSRFDYLIELQERLNYYLNEIELYLPNKK